MSVPTITDEKLDEYLAIWKRHFEQGRQEDLQFTLDVPVSPHRPFTLTFGEEKREVTYAQAIKFHETFMRLAEEYRTTTDA